jgi:hypothetical protein
MWYDADVVAPEPGGVDMRNYLIAVLAGAALVSCNQRPAPGPASAETAATPAAANSAPGPNDAPAPNGATPAATASSAPCTGDGCPQPPSGYDWAAAHNITDAKDCTEGDQAFKDGCALYVQEKAVEEGEKEFESDGQ